MKAKEFDEIFKSKCEEFGQTLGGVALAKGWRVHSIDVEKQRDFMYLFTLMVTKAGLRMLPMRMFYTVMYNPVTAEYMWHDGIPRAPRGLDGRVVN